jgi:hypothetical protein
MPGQRIPDLTAIAGASTANDDNLVIYDTSTDTTKRILRSQLAAGIVGDLPYTPAGFIAATTVPTAIAEIASDVAASGGSNLVGFLQAGTGAVATTVQAKLRESVSITDKGASTASADNTTAIQNALNEAGIITLPDGEFITGPLTLSSNTTLIFSPGTVLKAKTGFTQFERLLSGSAISNVTIFGNQGAIEMIKAEYVSGEDRHGLALFGACSNVTIYDLTIRDTGGDGFYIGGDNISLINCISDNARRNGLSIIQGRSINIIGGEYKNTIGVNPQAGIDIEPNSASEVLQNINLIGVTTSGNKATGISFVPFNTTNTVSINVTDCVSINDGSDAATGAGQAMLFALTPVHVIPGEIRITNYSVITPKCNGVVFFQWTENCPSIKMCNVNVTNPGLIASGSNSFNCGFIQSSSSDAGVGQGNFELIGCSAIDIRAIPFMRVGCFIQTQHMSQKNIRIENFKQFGQTSGFTQPVVIGSSFTLTNVNVFYTPSRVTGGAITTTLSRSDWGSIETNSAQTSHTVNLPVATGNDGLELGCRVDVAGGFVRLIPNAADTILRYASDASISVIAREVGDYIKVRSLGSNKWQVVEITGQWNSFISTIPSSYKRISNGNLSAAPTTGTWVVGDIVYNSTPAASGNIGWVCTTAGTPGTWKTFGAISA